ncbi:hypothetical protein KY363_07815 [Candidatus Woesearchaeota archaeon]|nr:hypothetical protein [Candidatus Woesearchaeota archaeon]
MAITGKQKEMLFILGEFLKETNRRFSTTPLKVTISKAEFIDGIREMGVVSKKERAVYRNLEELEKGRYIVYDDKKNLSMTKKGYTEYERIFKEFERMLTITGSIDAVRIRFKRKQQTRLV